MRQYFWTFLMAVTVADYHYDKLRDKCAWRSRLNSYGKAWIEQSRSLPPGRLVSLSVRFCENRKTTLQLWDETGEKEERKLVWQHTVYPTELLGTYTEISINQSAVPVMVTSSTRFGCYSTDNGMIPLFSRFLNGMKFATISSKENGPFAVDEKYMFSELTTPVYFDIIVCTENGCSNATREDYMSEVVDRCDASNLQRTSGRPLLEMHMGAPSGIIRALEMVICGVMPFFIQVWRPVQSSNNLVYQLVWQKHITCLPGRSNGRIVQITLEPEEYFYSRPEYRIGLHVEYGDFAVPVPTRFTLNPNIAMAMDRSQNLFGGLSAGFLPICKNMSFDDLAIPTEFKLRLCNSKDCSISTEMDHMESHEELTESQTDLMESQSDVMESSSTLKDQTDEIEYLEYLESLELYSCNPTTTTSTTVAMTTAMTTMLTTEEPVASSMTTSKMDDATTMTNASMLLSENSTLLSDGTAIMKKEGSPDYFDDIVASVNAATTSTNLTNEEINSTLSNNSTASMNSILTAKEIMSTTQTTISTSSQTTTKIPTTTLTTSTTTPRRVTTPKRREQTQPPAQAAKQNADSSASGQKTGILLPFYMTWFSVHLSVMIL